MTAFEDNHGRDITVGDYVWLDLEEELRRVSQLDEDTGCVIDENDEVWQPDDLELLTPHPADNPQWFHAPGSQRWIAPVGDGTIHVVLYDDELAALDAARAAAAEGVQP